MRGEKIKKPTGLISSQSQFLEKEKKGGQEEYSRIQKTKETE